MLSVKLQLGRLHELLGNWDQSLQYCEEAMRLAALLSDPVSESQALLTTGMIEKQRGDSEYARKCFETALSLAGDNDLSVKAVACYRIGSLFLEQGNWDGCEKRLREAMDYATASKVRVLVARTYNSLGGLEVYKGNMAQAVEWLEKCIPIYEEENDLYGLASTLHNIATAHLDQKNWQEAQAYYGRSLSISDRIGVTWIKCFSFLGRAACALGVRDIETAEEYAAKAANLLQVLEIEAGFGGYEIVMGMIEREKGRLAKAEEHFERALNAFRNAKNNMGIAETEFEMGILFMVKGEKTRASGCLRSAYSKFEEFSNRRKLAECKEKLDELEK